MELNELATLVAGAIGCVENAGWQQRRIEGLRYAVYGALLEMRCYLEAQAAAARPAWCHTFECAPAGHAQWHCIGGGRDEWFEEGVCPVCGMGLSAVGIYDPQAAADAAQPPSPGAEADLLARLDAMIADTSAAQRGQVWQHEVNALLRDIRATLLTRQAAELTADRRGRFAGEQEPVGEEAAPPCHQHLPTHGDPRAIYSWHCVGQGVDEWKASGACPVCNAQLDLDGKARPLFATVTPTPAPEPTFEALVAAEGARLQSHLGSIEGGLPSWREVVAANGERLDLRGKTAGEALAFARANGESPEPDVPTVPPGFGSAQTRRDR